MLNTVRIREMRREINLLNTAAIFDELKQQAVDDPRVAHWACWKQTGETYSTLNDPVHYIDSLLGFMLSAAHRRVKTTEPHHDE